MTDRLKQHLATEHSAHDFPHQADAHGPNLATLDQLRSRGRNTLLLRNPRRKALRAQGCTDC